MSSGIRSYVRQHHVGLICLFLILGGGAAYAADGPLAGQNTVGSEDIIGNEVKSDDIGNGRIFNIDVADEILTGQKLKDGTVTGDDVDESTLNIGCPPPYVPAGDICFLAANPTDSNHNDVQVQCDTLGARMPSVGEARLIQDELGPPGAGVYAIWTDDFTSSTTAIAVNQNTGGLVTNVDTALTSVIGDDKLCVLSPLGF